MGGSAVLRGQPTMLGATAPARRPHLRTIMGLWQASGAACASMTGLSRTLDTPQIAGLNIAYVPEASGIFRTDRHGENMRWPARAAPPSGADGRRGCRIFSLFPGGGVVLEPPGRQAVGRAEADAGGGARLWEPRELIIDEPSKGLAPAIINNMIDAFGQPGRPAA